MGSIIGSDEIDFLKEALKEEGLYGAKVTSTTGGSGRISNIRVEKSINGEKMKFSTSVTEDEIAVATSKKSYLATVARMISQDFESILVKYIKWGDNVVRFDFQDGYSASCMICGESVSMDYLNKMNYFVAESGVPQPKSYTKFDELPEVKIRMTLHALLARECEYSCPNSRMERKKRCDRKI